MKKATPSLDKNIKSRRVVRVTGPQQSKPKRVRRKGTNVIALWETTDKGSCFCTEHLSQELQVVRSVSLADVFFSDHAHRCYVLSCKECDKNCRRADPEAVCRCERCHMLHFGGASVPWGFI